MASRHTIAWCYQCQPIEVTCCNVDVGGNAELDRSIGGDPVGDGRCRACGNRASGGEHFDVARFYVGGAKRLAESRDKL